MQPEQDVKNFITNDTEFSWQEIISKLKFISNIKEYEKIDVQSMKTMENGYWTSTWRTLFSRGESREITLKFIKITIANAIMLCTQYIAMENEFFQKLGGTIGVELQDSRRGLMNLCKTYIADSMFVAKIKALILLIDTKIEELGRNFPDIIKIPSRAGISYESMKK